MNIDLANAASANKVATAASFHGGKAHSVFEGFIKKLSGK